jgi:putative tricarboxylic transport membrane protein
MTKRLSEIVVFTFFTVVAIALYRSTASFPEMTQGSTATYIRFLATSLGLLCVLELLLNIKKKSATAEGGRMKITSSPARFTALLILMFVYALLLEPLGFYVASVLFLPLTMFILGARKAVSIVLTSGGVLLFVFLVFAKLLGVPLPESTIF